MHSNDFNGVWLKFEKFSFLEIERKRDEDHVSAENTAEAEVRVEFSERSVQTAQKDNDNDVDGQLMSSVNWCLAATLQFADWPRTCDLGVFVC